LELKLSHLSLERILRERQGMSDFSRPVLVVDDDEMLGEFLAAILSDAGHEVIIATNGDEAVARAHLHSPSVVLCDMSMPGMSGAEVLRTLRHSPATAELPFVLMSGAPQTLVGPQPNAFLQKPFTPQTLTRKVHEVLNSSDHPSRTERAA
jgi:CheY-like chemotaxis protein